MSGSYIKHISYYLPEHIVTNDDLSSEFGGWDSEKILRKTGIRQRHCVKDETVSDLAVQAALNLFDESGIDISTIDFLLLCTQSPDYFLPTTACVVQDRLNLPTSIGALDFNLGCSGFVYGLALAKGLIVASVASNVLLITAETYTRHINPKDKSTRTLFGDGAAATLVSKSNVSKIGEFILGTDGKGAPNLIVPAGAMKLPKSPETAVEKEDESGSVRSLDNLYMNGPEIFSFTLRVVPEVVNQTLEKNVLNLEDVDLFVFHQANEFMLESLRRKIGIPKDKFYVNLETKGNTVSATIPIALKDAADEGRLKPGYKVLIVGFGVGYSWGATIIEW